MFFLFKLVLVLGGKSQLANGGYFELRDGEIFDKIF